MTPRKTRVGGAFWSLWALVALTLTARAELLDVRTDPLPPQEPDPVRPACLFVNLQDSPDNAVSSFVIESNGELSRIGRFATGGDGSGPTPVAAQTLAAPVEGWLLATDSGSGEVSLMEVDTDCRLERRQSVALAAGPASRPSAIVTTRVAPFFVYVATEDPPAISILRPTDAGLVEVPGSPVTTEAGAPAVSLAVVDSGGRRALYASIPDAGVVELYLIGPDGELSYHSAFRAEDGDRVAGLAVNPRELLLAVGYEDPDRAVFGLYVLDEAIGLPEPVDESPFVGRASEFDSQVPMFDRRPGPISPAGDAPLTSSIWVTQFLADLQGCWIIEPGSGLSQPGIGLGPIGEPTGKSFEVRRLEARELPNSPFPTRVGPSSLAQADQPAVLYVLNTGEASVTGHQILADGTLVELSTTAPLVTSGQPIGLAVSR